MAIKGDRRHGNTEKNIISIFFMTSIMKNAAKDLVAFTGWSPKIKNASIASLIRGKSVLDVGAGHGTLTKYPNDLGYNATGIEPNIEKIATAREWYELELLPIRIYDSSFQDNQFDCVALSADFGAFGHPVRLKSDSQFG